MQQNQETQFYDFQNLPMINSLDQQLLMQLDALMTGNWVNAFQGITALRSINKYYPQFTPDAMGRYINQIIDLINNGKTQIVKNSFILIKQVFRIGKQINVEKCVFAFAGIMIKKSATQLGKVKEMASDVLVQFVNNCGYDISFVIVSQYCCDKNSTIAEISIKMMAKLIENIGMQITQLKPQTLQNIMKSLTFLLDGKRQNVKTWAREICMYIYNTIGNENYLSLMSYVLSKQQMDIMMNQMQTKKLTKSKQIVPLASVLKQRKSMMKANWNNNNMNQNNMNQNMNQNMNNSNMPFMNNVNLLNNMNTNTNNMNNYNWSQNM